MTTYKVTNLRVVKPSGKTAENNPDRFLTIFGVFHDADGKEMSIKAKAVSIDEARSSEFSIDLEKGILTLPSGKRGRVASASLSAEDIASELAFLRNSD